jgi:hypothetical protein
MIAVQATTDCEKAKSAFIARMAALPAVQMALLSARQLEPKQNLFECPLADGTVMKALKEIKDKALVLMADIFPTEYFGATNAFRPLTPEQITDSTAVVIGCDRLWSS